MSRSTTRQRLRRAAAHMRAVAILVAVALLTIVPGTARAADGAAVTWSVQPADASAPDGRPWVEQTMDPGENMTEHLAVHNFSDREVTFRLTAADGFFNQNGRFNILAAGEASTEAGTWIDIPDSVTVAAGQTQIVGFDIDVPATAEPGDHAAGVAASISSTSTDGGGASVGVESRIGFRVMIRVAGELAPAAVVENVTTSYRTSWNPFVPGSATIDFDVRNVGNVRVKASGSVATGGQTAQFPPADQPQELLAGDTRHFRVTVGDVWPLVVVGGTLTVDLATAVTGDSAPAGDPVRTDFTVIAVPWPQAAVVVGLILLVGAVVWRSRRTRDHWTARVESARREGREEALRRERENV